MKVYASQSVQREDSSLAQRHPVMVTPKRPSFKSKADSISPEELLALYATMLRIRLVQLRIEELYPKDEMKTPVHLCIGQEAVAAGVCANLQREDYVFSNHRGHGHYLAKGGDLRAMIAELYCRETGCSKGRGGSMHLVDRSVGLMGSSSIVAGSVPLATGAALSSQMKRDGRVSVGFFGDAAAEEGVVYESVNFAVLKRLPVVFVCENNFYAVFSPLRSRQAFDGIHRRFAGCGIPTYQVNGNNVLEVYRIAQRAVEAARNGAGPSFVECRTYRWRGHSGGGSEVERGYRTQEEVDEWVKKCPVKTYERFLTREGLLTVEDKARITQSIQREIDDAFEFAQASPLPKGSDVLKYLYG